jgi:hypothetical protein
MIKQFKIMGIGKHSEEEIINIGCADLKALSAILAEKPYFLGDKPTAVRREVFLCLLKVSRFKNFCRRRL